ncbi:MAG: NAD(P)-dependent oxidoreductase [Chthoniobacteraceae bacterium]
MIIYFVEIEPPDQALYSEALAEHSLLAVKRLGEVGPDAEIISVFINEQVDAAFLEGHPNLRMIAARSTSIDHIDESACRARGVTVCNVEHYGETTIAEHTFALILALARRLRELMNLPQGGRFSYEATRGFELHGKTFGIIGVGRVGQRVISLAHGFQMQVLGYDTVNPERIARTLHFDFVSLDELLARSDVISLHANLTPETYHILNRETLAKTKRGVLIINTARGALLETAALREALDSGHVGGAGLDVLQDERVLRQNVASVIGGEILQHLRRDDVAREARDADRVRELEELILGNAVLARSNVVFTPHVAFNSVEAVRRLADATIENIKSFIAKSPIHSVSSAPMNEDHRAT